MSRYEVRTYGWDCLGNITGFRVKDTETGGTVAQFTQDIYVVGSYQRAKQAAQAECDRLNKLNGD